MGRLAPNKGHSHLLRVVHFFRSQTGKNLRLRIVGAIDPELGAYHRDLLEDIVRLNLQEYVELIPHSTDAELLALFRSAHVYLCFSEHEGFCVPIVEAQSMGLPIAGSGATAVGETAGPEQFIANAPASPEDYSFYAALVDRIVCDSELRSASSFKASLMCGQGLSPRRSKTHLPAPSSTPSSSDEDLCPFRSSTFHYGRSGPHALALKDSLAPVGARRNRSHPLQVVSPRKAAGIHVNGPIVDLEEVNGMAIDRVIALKFPAYYRPASKQSLLGPPSAPPSLRSLWHSLE